MTDKPEQLDLVVEVNRRKLIDFFDAGAPHFEFDMRRGLVVKTFHAHEVPSTCGSAGCIAGAAFTMWLQTIDPAHRAEVVEKGATLPQADEPGHPDPGVEYDYNVVTDGALEFLGLPRTAHEGMQFGHPLFSPLLAPPGCTAADAAEALRRTFKGEYPWSR